MRNVEHVAGLLAPWRVVDLCHDVLHTRPAGIEAVVETHGVEAVAEVGQMSEKANGTHRAMAGSLLDEIRHRFAKWLCCRPQVIASPKDGDSAWLGGKGPPMARTFLDFVQIEIRHEQPVAKTV